MNKVFVIFSLLTIIILVSQTNFSNSSSFTPPNARTGAPGESNCSVSCHTGAQNPSSGTNNISFNFDGGNNIYLPGQTYNVSITLADASKVRFGFSSTVLDASNQAVGNFVVTNTGNTSIGNNGGRQYMRHKSAGSTQTWNFQWEAPATSQGDVTFYIAAVAANAANGNGGDNVYLNDFTVSAGSTPPASVVDFFVDKDSSCVNTEFIFNDNSQGNISDWSWDFGSGASPLSASGSGPHLVTYSTIGPKNVELQINTSDQGIISKDSIIQVYPQVNISVSDDTSFVLSDLNTGFTFPLLASGADNYNWSPSLGLNNTQISNPIFDPFAIAFQAADTQIIYIVTGTDSLGICSDIKAVRINLKKTDATTGVDIVAFEDLNVFPNPVIDFLRVEASIPIEELSLFNLEGKLLLQQSFAVSKNQVLINRNDDWYQGMYFLKLKSIEGKVQIQKLIFE